MMAPSPNAIAMRVPSSMGVMPPPIQAALNERYSAPVSYESPGDLIVLYYGSDI